MTNETEQEKKWKAEKATNNIWKIREALEAKEKLRNAIYEVCGSCKVPTKIFSKSVGSYASKLYFHLEPTLVEYLDKTFGTEERPVSDTENRLNCQKNTSVDSVIKSDVHYNNSKRRESKPKWGDWTDYQGKARYFVEGMLTTEEERQAFEQRKLNREQFEDILMRSSVPHTLSDRLGLSNNPQVAYLFNAIKELWRTPYVDRAQLGSQPTLKPYEVQEFTPEEWETKRTEIFKPTEERK